MDLTLLGGSSWLIKPFCSVFFFCFFPKAEVGQQGRSTGRLLWLSWGRAECSGSFADLARGLVWP